MSGPLHRLVDLRSLREQQAERRAARERAQLAAADDRVRSLDDQAARRRRSAVREDAARMAAFAGRLAGPVELARLCGARVAEAVDLERILQDRADAARLADKMRTRAEQADRLAAEARRAADKLRLARDEQEAAGRRASAVRGATLWAALPPARWGDDR